MDCPELRQASSWIDDELSPEESDAFARHLEECGMCRGAVDDYQRLRRQLDAQVPPPAPRRQARARERLLRTRAPLWRRTVAVPVPALAAGVILAFGLAGWVALELSVPDSRKRRAATIERPGGRGDLSRFDRGGRALVYKEARS